VSVTVVLRQRFDGAVLLALAKVATTLWTSEEPL
jgi:hypothetical protein